MTYQWLNLQETLGLEVRVAKVQNGRITPENLFELVDERTKAVTVCHVDSGTGYRHDLKKIGSWCRSHHIPFWCGCDTVPCGAMKINVQEMNVDFLTTSVYKWLQGIQGLGFAYIPLFYENSFSDGNGLGQSLATGSMENPLIYR